MISIKKILLLFVITFIASLFLFIYADMNSPKEIQIPGVIDLNYEQALEKLKQSGVKNITSNIDEYSMIDKEKLIVVAQNIRGVSMDNQTVDIQVNALFTGKIMIDIVDIDEFDDINLRVVINNQTVARINSVITTYYTGEFLEPFIYVMVIDENDNSLHCGAATSFSGDFSMNFNITKQDGKLKVVYQSVHEYIYK